MEEQQPGSQHAEQPRTWWVELLWRCSLLPILGLVVLVTWGTVAFLGEVPRFPIWLSMPIGVALGVLLVSGIRMSQGNSLLEWATHCGIFCIFLAILIPILSNARKEALMTQGRSHLAPTVRLPARDK